MLPATVPFTLKVASTCELLTNAAAELDTAIVEVTVAVLTLIAFIEAAETILVLGLANLTLFTTSAIIVVIEAVVSDVRTRFAARLLDVTILAAAKDSLVILPTIEVVAKTVAAADVNRVRLAAMLVVVVEIAVPAALRILI